MERTATHAPTRTGWALAAWLLCGAVAAAEPLDQPIAFDVPAQPLGSALRQVAKQAGLQLLFAPDAVGDRLTAGLRGRFTPRAALNQLLASAGLEAYESAPGVIALRVRAPVTVSELSPINPAAPAGVMPARQPLDPVVVTAQRREQPLRDVPISMLVERGADLAFRGIGSVAEATTIYPNVSMTPGPASDQLYVRGVGSGINGGFEQSVGTFVDGIYHGRSRYTRGLLVDVERIEVLRGPQSIYFGNHAIGGALNITTRRPGATWDGYVQTSWEFDAQEAVVTAAAGGPLGDTVGLRVAAQYSSMAGYVENTLTGRRDPSPEHRLGRVHAVWRPADSVEVGLKLERARLDNPAGLPIQLTDCPPAPPYDRPGMVCANALLHPSIETRFDARRSAPAGERVATDASEAVLSLTSEAGTRTFAATLGHTQYDHYTGADTDFAPESILAFSVPERFEQQSLELRLSSARGEPIEWIAGAYAQRSELRYETAVAIHFATPVIEREPALAPLRGSVPIGSHAVLEQDERSVSAFGAVTWHAAARLRSTLAARWTAVRKDARQAATSRRLTDPWGAGEPLPLPLARLAAPLTGATPHDVRIARRDDAFMPSVTVQFDASDELTTYASIARGFKAGGFDAHELSGQPDRLSFGPETVTAYELGLKGAWGPLALNAAAFHADYDDLQQSVAQTSASGVLSFSVGNVGALVTRGVEVDAAWQLAGPVRLTVGAAWLDARYRDYRSAGCTAPQQAATPPGVPCVQDLSGAAPPFAPSYAGTIALDWNHRIAPELRLVANAILTFKGEYDVVSDNDPVVRQPAHRKLDARLGIVNESQGWEVAVLGRNLTDELTSAFGQDAVGPGSYWRLLERPRSVALQAWLRW